MKKIEFFNNFVDIDKFVERTAILKEEAKENFKALSLDKQMYIFFKYCDFIKNLED